MPALRRENEITSSFIARRRGKIRCAAYDAAIAEVIFYVFAADVRRWLGKDNSSTASGLAHLKGLFAVVVTGLEEG